ncbi:MAG: hypothetical protein WC806_05220 [Candidatus Gracilibacteria bacterium]|jgi:VIT1/CCC1 family predicted Fe2+/Mn2+ transporter
MKHSHKIGICFGITSGIITTLGLLVGLSAGTQSKLVVLGGIFTIAIADAFSDSLGIHISEESDPKNSTKEVWESTISTFIAKFLFALTFAIPVILLDLGNAVIASIAWGLLVLSILTYVVAKDQKESAPKAIFEHIFTAIVVIFLTHNLGHLINKYFGE